MKAAIVEMEPFFFNISITSASLLNTEVGLHNISLNIKTGY